MQLWIKSSVGENANYYNHYRKQFGNSSINLKWICHITALPLLVLYSKEVKLAYERNIYISMFMTPQFTKVNMWNQTLWSLIYD